MLLRRPRVVPVLAAALLLTASTALFAGDVAAPGCGPVVELEGGAGPACRDAATGLWRLQLPDGGFELTHGPDPLSAFAPWLELPFEAMPRAAPACVAEEDAASEAHGLLLYARAFDAEDRYETMAPIIQQMFLVANAWLLLDGAKDGMPARFAMLCDAQGMPVVREAVLPTSVDADSAGTIFRDLRNGGWNSPQAKYWVWYDGAACGCAGIGTINGDSRPGPENRNNVGPDWGITFRITGTSGAKVMMHENGHNLGAVQLNSPNTSGGWHCNDGTDVMCYNDGGSSANYDPTVCPSWHGGLLPEFDCNGDDYYHTMPPAGSYLATHWNLGSGNSKWVRVGA